MSKYAIDFQRTASTSASVGSIGANATRPRRMKVYDIVIGSEATPADASIQWRVQRATAQGTSTAVVPQPLDPADAATEATAGENHTVEPTYTAAQILLNLPLNQRATFRWVAAPGGELVTPAVASNGLGVATPVLSTGTPVITAQLHVEEQ